MITPVSTSLAVAPIRPVSQNTGQTDTLANAETQEELTIAEQQIEQAVEGIEEQAAPTILDTELTPEEEQIVRELQQRDREVRAHERAHKSIAGSLAGPIQYEFTRGPDGSQYAIAGEVSIDTSPENTPEATIRKMDVVIRAALAPADPSPQDLAVARAAQQARLQAQREARAIELAEQEASQNGDQESNQIASQQNTDEEQRAPIEELQAENTPNSSANDQNKPIRPLAEIAQAIQALNNASLLSSQAGNSAVRAEA